MVVRASWWGVLGVVGLACAGEVGAPAASPSAASVPTADGGAVPAPRADGRLPKTALPRAYRIELHVDPEATGYSGSVEIDVEVAAGQRALVLHARELEITKAALNLPGRVLEPTRISSRPPAHATSPDELVLEFREPVPRGPATLRLEFRTDYASGLVGLYRTEARGKAYLFTKFEPTDARRAFPCFDEPEFKVPVTTTLIVPEGQLAFANTPETGRTEIAGQVRFDFAPSPPLPTYLVAFAVGPLDVEAPAREGTPIRLLAARGKGAEGRLSLRVAAEHLAILERYFGSPYPYAKLDLVAVPEFSAGAMENSGLVTFREERLLVTEQASTGLRRAAAGTIAHELAHMWFGNLVTMKWWDDLWLNEAFASWMANRVLDAWRPDFEASEAALGHKASAMWLDTLSTSRKVRQEVRSTAEALEAFDSITYSKGMSILDMTEAWVGAEAFQTGIQRYMVEHAWKNASSHDLFAAVGEASQRNVTSVLDSFTTQTGVPLVSARWECPEAGRLRVDLAQSEYRPLGSAQAAGAKRWAIPVCVRYGAAKSSDSACTLLDAATATIESEVAHCPTWLAPNVEHAGYYYSALSGDALGALTRAKLSNREAAGLAVDAWALVASGALPIDEYLQFIEKFAGGRRRAVWSSVERALRAIEDELLGDEQRVAFARFVRRLVRPHVLPLGWTPRAGESDETSLMRKDLLWMLGALGEDEATLRKARQFYDQWMSDPDSVPADIAGVAITLTAARADRELVSALLQRVAQTEQSDVRVTALHGLGAVADPELVPLVLGGLLDGSIRAQDQRYLLWPLFGRRTTRDAAFAWLEQHFEALLDKLPVTSTRSVVAAVANHCSAEHAARVEAFLGPRLPRLVGGERALAQSLESGHRCVALREHAGEPLRAYLSRR